ncbi:MAG: hypothetical protein ACRDO8_11325, partial [Nocardioidaceae bacterium]
RADVDPRAAASLLLGGCLQHAFLTSFAGRTESARARREETRSLAHVLAGSLVDGGATAARSRRGR